MITEDLIKGKLFQIGAGVVASFISISEGLSFGWTSPMIPYFLSNQTHIVMTRDEAEWLETSLLLGSFFGLPLTALAVDKLGRKMSILYCCGILAVSWAVIALANQIAYLYAARFVQGIGISLTFTAAPMYVGEIAHKSIRGFLSSLVFLMSFVGLVIIYSTGPVLPFYVPCVIAIAILVLEIFVFSFIPESPYFLIEKNRDREAATALRKFNNFVNVDIELKEIKNAIENENKEKGHIKDVLLVKNYRQSLLIMFVLNTGQLFAGFDLILMNLEEIFTAADSAYMTVSQAVIALSSINLFSALMAAILVDRFGRKKLLFVSTLLTASCLFCIALYFHLRHMNYDISNLSWLPILCIFVYAAVFRVGLGMVPTVLTAEIFASKIKAFGVTFAEGVYAVMSVLALQVFFVFRDWYGIHMPFYIFSCSATVTLFFILYLVPETKGRNLEEIQEILRH